VTRAVIFDMDGVVSDTERLHVEAETVILARHAVPLPAAGQYAGMPDAAFFRTVFAAHGRQPDVEALIAEKWRVMAGTPDAGIRAMRGARQLIAALRRRGVALALASSSPRAFVERVLACLDLREAFAVTVSGGDVARGKPAPDIFLRAAERLGVPPAACVVIEDAVLGMRAARRAGMPCVGVMAGPHAAACPADLVVESLAALTPEALLALAPPAARAAGGRRRAGPGGPASD
jgi:HAD superfamily hydrolase (TIGR01509 family)